MHTEKERVVCWFSCGRASAYAAKIALEVYKDKLPVEIVYCAGVEGNEHPDNARFIKDCEKWYGQPIIKAYSPKYKDIFEVFDKTGWLVGPQGARCTTELKKKVRQQYEDIDKDIQVFGFMPEERPRWERFKETNWEISPVAPLITQGLTRIHCNNALRDAGLVLPAMYRMGYHNNNCLGCVKGGAGYWNKIRLDFPEVFARMAAQERKMNVKICKTTVKGERVRVFLDELPPGVGRYEEEPSWECGIGCSIPVREGEKKSLSLNEFLDWA